MKIFAKAGEQITCENGHYICSVVRDIVRGDIYAPTFLGGWVQPEPKYGDKEIKCNLCGTLFWHGNGGQHFHFKEGWRERSPDGKKVRWWKKLFKRNAK